MSKLNYRLSTKVDGNGKSQILVRFVASNKEMWRGKTGIWIKPDNWDKRQNYPRASRRDQADIAECRRVQAKLDDLTRFVTERYKDDREHGEKWLTELLSRLSWDNGGLLNKSGSDFATMVLSASCRMMVETCMADKMFTKGTAHGYIDIAKKMERYEKEHGCVRVGEFNAQTLDDFLSFCRENYSLADNTVYDLRVRVMRWWHWCRSKDNTLIDLPPTAGKVRGKAYGTPYYLTKEQRDILYHAPMPSKDIEETRDAFILQCLVGCRISDLRTFTPANIKGDYLEYIAVKTLHSHPETISVPLHHIAKEIIDKYKGSGWLAPASLAHHETFKRRLRKAIKVSGIDCMITVRDCHTGQPKQVMLSEVASSHMARRTFIGCLYEVGFRESDICSMSGHKEGSLSIQRYRRVSDERKRMMIDAI